MAVLPATTPERATDFLTLGVGLGSDMGAGSGGAEPELFGWGVTEEVVEVGPGLHPAGDVLLRAVLADCRVNLARGGRSGARSGQRVKHHGDARGAEFIEREIRRLAELGK